MRIKVTKLLVLIFIISFLVSCQINEQIFGRNQDKPDFYIDKLKFEDLSIDKVYVIFNLHNNLNETANCSARISLYKDNKTISENEYYIGNIDKNSMKKNKILVDMPKGRTKVNVEPLCEKNQIVGQQQENNQFIIEDLELISSSSKKEVLTFKLINTQKKTANCSAKVIMVKNDKTIFEKAYYIGYVKGNFTKKYQIPVNVPLGTTLVDVVPLCALIENDLQK